MPSSLVQRIRIRKAAFRPICARRGQRTFASKRGVLPTNFWGSERQPTGADLFARGFEQRVDRLAAAADHDGVLWNAGTFFGINGC
jgi:hypothetical protein